jgi:hypothetical protein
MALINYYSIVTYVYLSGGTAQYNVTFPFLYKEDVRVYRNGTQLSPSQYTWLDDTRIQITASLIDQDKIVFRRFTRSDQRWADYHNGSTLTETDLNIVTLQLLYLIQELYDYGFAGSSGDPPPGGTPGGPGGTGDDDPLIEQIINDLLATQLFQDLIELIELVDINAEALISTMISTHERWGQDRTFTDTIRQVEADIDQRAAVLHSLVEQNSATIVTLNTTVETNRQVLAQQIELVAADLGEATALIGEVDTAVATLTSATASRFTLVEARVGNNEASIGSLDQAIVDETGARIQQYNQLDAAYKAADLTLQGNISTVNQLVLDKDSAMGLRMSSVEVSLNGAENGPPGIIARVGEIESAYVDEDEATALITQQISTAFAPANFNNALNASSVITGIQTTSTAERASVDAISSFLVGSGFTRNPTTGAINWGAPATGSLAQTLASVQQTQGGHATQLSAEASLRQALASRFAPGSSTDGPAMVAALENSYKTYADSQSATVSRVSTLEANRQPVFFRVNAPNWTASEFANTPFGVAGFPEGSLWYRDLASGLKPYIWVKTLYPPPYVAFDDPCFGPYAKSGQAAQPGLWVPKHDAAIADMNIAIGGRFDELANIYVTDEEVGVITEERLEAVFGMAVSTISERLGTYAQDDGSMYSTWNVRINQYSGGGFPAIAGVGLGMQTDPTNPNAATRSDFMVMANYFSVIAPPTSGDPLTGQMNPASVRVPFLVDTGNDTIYLNGNVIARKTLSAYDGMMGRLQIGQLDPNTGYLADPDGFRLILPSSTNNFNASNTVSPFTGGQQRFLLWAGNSTMNHQNAKFYVDTDGNAVFAGEVQADNVVGTMNNVVSINTTLGSIVTAPSNGSWVTLGEEYLPAPTSLRGRVPFAIISTNVFGDNVQTAAVRLMMSHQDPQSGSWSGYEEVAYGYVATPTGTYLTISGGLGYAVTGAVKLAVQIAKGPEGSTPCQSNRYSGLLIGIR